MAREFSGTGQYITLASGLGLGANDPCWMSGWFWVDVGTVTQVLFSLGVAGSGNDRRDVVYYLSSLNLAARSTNSATSNVYGTFPGTGLWFHALAEWADASNRAFTVNGVGRTTELTTRIIGVAPNEVRIGATHTASSPLDGRAGHVGIFSGIPTADQRRAAALGIHPMLLSPQTLLEGFDLDGRTSPERGYKGGLLTLTGSPTYADAPRILRPHGRAQVTVPASTLNNYSLSAASAAYLWTPTAATLKRAYRLDAQGSTSTTTGTAATLRKAHVLAAAVATSAWTPTNAGLLSQRRVSAATAAYAWAATSANLNRGLRFSVDAAAYAWTPVDATIYTLGDYEMGADSGVYSWTPTTAVLRVAHRLAADGASYASTGTSAALTASRRLTASPGAYQATGTAAAFQRAYVASLEAAAYVATGTAADLLTARRISAGTVGYRWTPTAASVTYSGAVFEDAPIRMRAIADRMRDALADRMRDAIVGSVMERTIEKGPAEIKRVGVDWEKMLSINSAVIVGSSWDVTPAGPETSGPQFSDHRASVLIGGGEVDEDYVVVNTITTSDGQTLASDLNGADLIVQVR